MVACARCGVARYSVRRPGFAGALHKLRKHPAAADDHFQRRAAAAVLRSDRDSRTCAPTEPPATKMQAALRHVQALASTFGARRIFRRHSCARPQSWVQCWCARSRMAELSTEGAAAAVTGWHTAVSWCVPPPRHLILRAAARYVPHASVACSWRAAGRSRRRCWVVLCLWGAVSSGERRFDAKRPSRTHSRAIFEPFSLFNAVRAVGSTAHHSCWSQCHHHRLHFGHPRLALARWRCSHRNHDAFHEQRRRALTF